METSPKNWYLKNPVNISKSGDPDSVAPWSKSRFNCCVFATFFPRLVQKIFEISLQAQEIRKQRSILNWTFTIKFESRVNLYTVRSMSKSVCGVMVYTREMHRLWSKINTLSRHWTELSKVWEWLYQPLFSFLGHGWAFFIKCERFYHGKWWKLKVLSWGVKKSVSSR